MNSILQNIQILENHINFTTMDKNIIINEFQCLFNIFNNNYLQSLLEYNNLDEIGDTIFYYHSLLNNQQNRQVNIILDSPVLTIFILLIGIFSLKTILTMSNKSLALVL